VNKVTTGTIATTTGETPYVRFGDWVVLLCGLGMVAAAVVAVLRARAAADAP
jgi:apolipoprotein N-acyltransferase